MLRFRLLSALIITSCALAVVALEAFATPWNCPGFWIVPLVAYFFFGSAIECVAMCRHIAGGSIAAPALIGCAGVMVAASIPVYWPLSGQAYPEICALGELGCPLAATAIALVGSFVWFFRCYQPYQGVLLRAILSGWVAAYFGISFAFAVAIRQYGTPQWGLFLLVGMIVVTKSADTGAYFAGKALGKRKLIPTVSPGKTIEGLIGGTVVAIVAAWIYFGYCGPLAFGKEHLTVGWLGIVAVGVCLTLAGVFGDLVESVFKREAGIKDSGKLLPGLGGLWDVMDSLQPAACASYLLVAAGFIQGPVQ